MGLIGPFEIFKAPVLRRFGGRLVLVCYLDDSYTRNGPSVSLSGYLSVPNAWEIFENEAQAIFDKHGVSILTAKHFHHKKEEFKNWSASKKEEFVEELFLVANKYVMKGVSGIVQKKAFYSFKSKNPGMQNMSPLGFAFSTTVSAVLLKPPFETEAQLLGVSFLVEDGNPNNGNIVNYAKWMRKQIPPYNQSLGPVSFVSKDECIGVQLADFLSFYARRQADAWDEINYPRELPGSFPLKLMGELVPTYYERFFDVGDEAAFEGLSLEQRAIFLRPSSGGTG